MRIEVDLDETTYKGLQNMARSTGRTVEQLVGMMLAVSVKSMVKMIGAGGVEGLLKMVDSLRQVEGVKTFEEDWQKAREENPK